MLLFHAVLCSKTYREHFFINMQRELTLFLITATISSVVRDGTTDDDGELEVDVNEFVLSFNQLAKKYEDKYRSANKNKTTLDRTGLSRALKELNMESILQMRQGKIRIKAGSDDFDKNFESIAVENTVKYLQLVVKEVSDLPKMHHHNQKMAEDLKKEHEKQLEGEKKQKTADQEEENVEQNNSDEEDSQREDNDEKEKEPAPTEEKLEKKLTTPPPEDPQNTPISTPNNRKRSVSPGTATSQRKRFQNIAVNLINSIQAHRFSSPFLQPVNKRSAPDYYECIYQPKDLKGILRAVKLKQDPPVYELVKELERDIMLMFANCVMYNKSDGDLVELTRSMCSDVSNMFKMFEEAELDL